MSSQSDNELWSKVTTGDGDAFADLYNRYSRQLFKTASFYLKDSSLAEEIVHDVFVVLWQRRAFLKINNLQSYILITTRYHVYKKLKEAKISPIQYIESYDEVPDNPTVQSPTYRLSQEDFEIELRGYLQGVPKRCSEIFLLSRVKQLSNTEIASFLGIKRVTVENQITHALKYLRGFLSSRSPDL
jgi:RNA polymerase sigma-70 factor (ECF subfamily)